jgi:F0F1-type ATP synthase assembly protein I
MRIGKPLLITTTAIGLPIGIFEAFHLAGTLGFLAVALIGLFGAAMLQLVLRVRAEARKEKGASREAGARIDNAD